MRTRRRNRLRTRGFFYCYYLIHYVEIVEQDVVRARAHFLLRIYLFSNYIGDFSECVHDVEIVQEGFFLLLLLDTLRRNR